MTFAPFANRAYRHLFTAHVVALLGTGLLTVALGLIAFDIGGDNAAQIMGLAMTVKMIAYVGAAPLMAAVVDRLPAKVVLVASDVVRAGIAVCLPLVHSAWQIYVLTFVLQVASATFTPRFQALIPTILDDEDTYTQALSFSRIAYDVEALVSPLLASALLLVTSYSNLFAGTAAGFIVSAVCVVTASLPGIPPAPNEGGAFLARAARGVRAFGQDRRLGGVAWLNMAVAAPMAVVIVLTPSIVQVTLARPASSVGVLLAFFGAGSMATAVVLPRVVARVRMSVVMLVGAIIAMVACVGMLASLAAGPSVAWAGLCVSWVVCGAGIAAMTTPTSKMVAVATTPQSRNQVFAAQFALSHACYLVAYPVMGVLGSHFGPQVAIAVAAVVGAWAATQAARLWWPSSPQALPGLQPTSFSLSPQPA